MERSRGLLGLAVGSVVGSVVGALQAYDDVLVAEARRVASWCLPAKLVPAGHTCGPWLCRLVVACATGALNVNFEDALSPKQPQLSVPGPRYLLCM